MTTAIGLLIALIIACVVGTFLPQGVANYYIYGSFWFQSILVLLLLSIAWGHLRKIPNSIKALAILLIHLSIILILLGAYAGFFWGDKGFIKIAEKQSIHSAVREDGSQWELPFEVYLDDFILEMHPLKPKSLLKIVNMKNMETETLLINGQAFLTTKEGIQIDILDVIPDPAIHIQMNGKKQWIFAQQSVLNTPVINSGFILIYHVELTGGEVKDYKSVLEIREDNHKKMGKIIEVNSPLKYRGYTIYQAAYDQENHSWSGLIIKKDPGVWLVYLGGILLIVGLLLHFYLKGKKLRC